MKLYSSDISPYASRVRIQVHHKQLPVEIAPPPGGMRSAQVLTMNPAGRIPVLDLGDAQFGESWAIMEFLETRFPTPPMLSAEPVALARQRELVRFADLYLAMAMFPMFLALRGTAGKEEVDKAQVNLAAQLKVLEQFLALKAGGGLDLADAALVPIVWYARCMAAHFGQPDCLADLPKTRTWWARVNAVPAVAKVTGEIEAGLRKAVPVLFKN